MNLNVAKSLLDSLEESPERVRLHRGGLERLRASCMDAIYQLSASSEDNPSASGEDNPSASGDDTAPKMQLVERRIRRLTPSVDQALHEKPRARETRGDTGAENLFTEHDTTSLLMTLYNSRRKVARRLSDRKPPVYYRVLVEPGRRPCVDAILGPSDHP